MKQADGYIVSCRDGLNHELEKVIEGKSGGPLALHSYYNQAACIRPGEVAMLVSDTDTYLHLVRYSKGSSKVRKTATLEEFYNYGSN